MALRVLRIHRGHAGPGPGLVIRAVVAMDVARGIGLGGGLPWARGYPADLARFKALTLGTAVVVGRRTRVSMPPKMPGRDLVVVTTRDEFKAAIRSRCLIWGDVVIAGGATVFGWAIESGVVDEWHVTRIDAQFVADVVCPDFEVGLACVADAPGGDKGTRWQVWR